MKHHHSVVAAEPSARPNTEKELASKERASSDAKLASAVPVSQSTPTVTHDPNHEKIAQLAHSYWVERGYAHGFAEQDWLRAEQQLKARAATA